MTVAGSTWCAALALVASLAFLAGPAVGNPDTSRSEAKADGPPATLVAGDPARGAATDPVFALLKLERLSCTFSEEKHVALLARPLTSTGTIYFQRDRGIARSTLTPKAQHVVLTRTSLRIRTAKKTEEIPLDKSKDLRAFALIFPTLLRGDRAELEVAFDLGLYGSTKAWWALAFTPKTASLKKLIKRVVVFGHKTELVSLQVVEASGDTTVTRLTDIRTNADVPDTEIAKAFGSFRSSSMHSRGRAATLVAVLGTAIAFALAIPYFRWTTKITEFLPDDSEDRGAQIAALLAESELSQIMTVDLTLGEPTADPDRLRALTLSLVGFLRDQPDVAVARSGFAEDDVTAMIAFFGSWPAATFVPREAYAADAVRARLAKLKEALGGPMGVIVRDGAPRDPLGGMWEPLEALRGAQGTALVDDDGVVFTADHQHAFVFVATRSSPFDSVAQRRFRATLEGWMSRAAPAPARMQTAGTAQFAIASEAEIKGDVNRIGTISTIAILVIFLVLFGSVRLIALGVVPMLFGSAVAVLGCQALFGEIHGITIAFGTSLLGVGLDYVEHYYAHFVLTPEVSARATMKRVAPSLALGAATTIIGFVGLAASGIPGLRQMAAFSVIAILASMAATIWFVPQWMPTAYRSPRTLAVIDRAVVALLRRLTSRPWSRTTRVAVLGLAAIGAVVGLAQVRFSDNVNMLVDERGPHVVEDRAVRSRLGPESTAFAVVSAPTDEALLVAVGKACDELRQAAGTLTSFVPLDRIVPSREEQAARLAAARAAAPRIREVMAELEFVPEQFAEFWDSLAVTEPSVLTLVDVRRSPLAPLVTAWVPGQTTPIALIPLVDVKDVAALRAAVPSATIIVPREMTVELFRGVRIKTVVSSLLGFAVILLLLLVRYRSARKAAVALTPASLACVATVGTLVAVGTALTILHVMSLLLVISLGVDFGIFFVDTAETIEERARTLVSILTASVTTILSFGLLGLSSTPGLAAIGVTVTLGVTYSLVFCVVIASLEGPDLAPTSAVP